MSILPRFITDSGGTRRPYADDPDGTWRLRYECCCGVPSTCPCDAGWSDLRDIQVTECNGLRRQYRIKNYTKTLFTCTTCRAPSSSACDVLEWDGVFTAAGGSLAPCRWEANWYHNVSGLTTLALEDNRADLDDDAVFIELDTTNQLWKLLVVCFNSSGGQVTVWRGEKTVGDDPTGIYDRTGGCDSTVSSVVVEEADQCEIKPNLNASYDITISGWGCASDQTIQVDSTPFARWLDSSFEWTLFCHDGYWYVGKTSGTSALYKATTKANSPKGLTYNQIDGCCAGGTLSVS